MTKKEIKIGNRFGKYTIVSDTFINNRIKCRCDCGYVKEVYCYNLDKIRQCINCYHKSQRKYSPGDKVCQFTILELYKGRKVKVKCSCGVIKIISSKGLGKRVKSCGCNQNKIGIEHHCYKGTKYVTGTMFCAIKTRAKNRNHKLEVDIQYLDNLMELQNSKCALTKLPIFVGNTVINGSASLDRKNSKLGYIKGNVQWVHKDINKMKLHYDQKYFINMCKLVANNN